MIPSSHFTIKLLKLIFRYLTRYKESRGIQISGDIGTTDEWKILGRNFFRKINQLTF